jgi:hypothetical protein
MCLHISIRTDICPVWAGFLSYSCNDIALFVVHGISKDCIGSPYLLYIIDCIRPYWLCAYLTIIMNTLWTHIESNFNWKTNNKYMHSLSGLCKLQNDIALLVVDGIFILCIELKCNVEWCVSKMRTYAKYGWAS